MTLQETCETYYNMVYRRCLFEMNFNEEIAEEVTQQVFLVLCEKWTMLKYHPNLQGWLLKTSYYKLKKSKVRICTQHAVLFGKHGGGRAL